MPPPGPPSLQALCLGCLGLHIPDLVEYGDVVLPFLPTQAKAALLAAARRRRQLDDVTLALLADKEYVALDVHGAHPAVTEPGLLRAVACMTDLRLVDCSSIVLSPVGLASLARTCPKIELLRLGETSAWRSRVYVIPSQA